MKSCCVVLCTVMYCYGVCYGVCYIVCRVSMCCVCIVHSFIRAAIVLFYILILTLIVLHFIDSLSHTYNKQITTTALRRPTRIRTVLSQFGSFVGTNHHEPDNPQAHWWKMPILSSRGQKGCARATTPTGPQGTPYDGTASLWIP